MPMPDLYVFEGGDACGKATQSKLLASALKTRVMDFPSYQRTPTGRVIDDLLHLSKEHQGLFASMFPRSAGDLPFARLLQNAMTWDRYACRDLWEAPEGQLVLDRYFMSGCIFGALDGLPIDELIQGHRGLPPAKVAFLLDVPEEVQFERIVARGKFGKNGGEDDPDIYEARQGLRERLTRIRAGYLKYFRHYGPISFPRTQHVILDGTLSAEEIHHQVLQRIGFTR